MAPEVTFKNGHFFDVLAFKNVLKYLCYSGFLNNNQDLPQNGPPKKITFHKQRRQKSKERERQGTKRKQKRKRRRKKERKKERKKITREGQIKRN